MGAIVVVDDVVEMLFSSNALLSNVVGSTSSACNVGSCPVTCEKVVGFCRFLEYCCWGGLGYLCIKWS